MEPTERDTRNLNIRCPLDLYRKLEALALKERSTLTRIVLLMIEKQLQEDKTDA